MAGQGEKIAMVREMMGNQVDAQVAAAMLEAHGWDVERTINTMLSGGDVPPARPEAPANSVGGWNGLGGGQEETRAPMATGYTSRLIDPPTLHEQMRVEEERREREREQQRQMEERKAAQELARKKDMERQVLDQRKAAEIAAFQRRRAKQEAEEQAWRQSKAAASAAANAVANAQGIAESTSAAAAGAASPAAATPAVVGTLTPAAPTVPLVPAVAEAPGQASAVSSTPAAAASAQEATTSAAADPAAPYEAARPAALSGSSASKPKEADAIAQALMALRKNYRETDRAGLIRCLQTLKVYISNLANAPHEPKFQRINCQNAAFKERVGAFDGAVAVLEACGFTSEDSALVAGPDFLKSKGSKLFDALSKINVLIDQLQ